MSLYFFNFSHFSSASFGSVLEAYYYGLRFDLSILFMLGAIMVIGNALPLGFRRNRIYQNILNSVSLTLFSLALVFNFIDAVYYRFSQKRMTFDIFHYINKNGGFVDVLPRFLIDFWFVSIWVLSSIILMVYLYTRIRLNRKIEKTGWRFYSWSMFLFFVSAAMIIVGIRGGVQLKPINIVDASVSMPARFTPLVLNTPFAIIKSYGQKGLELKDYFSEDEIKHIYNPENSYLKLDDTPKGIKNVVILILESFSAEHFGYFGNKTSFTPFLDSLFKHSLVFKGMANGKRSIEGIPAILSSLPTLSDESFVNGPYAMNQIEGLAATVVKHQYKTAFFHGGKNGTMSFDAYAYASGFQEYYGLNEYPYPDDYDGHWGVWDELYLKYFSETISGFEAPFMAALFTLSSHHPYQIPQKYQAQLPHGKLPIQKAIAYTDLALRNFFKHAQSQDWYQHTLFVITADHTSEGASDEGQNAYGQFSVPIAFYVPSDSIMKTRSSKSPVQQIDIYPSVLQYLGIEDTIICFGNSVFQDEEHAFAINHYNHQIQILDSVYLLQIHNDQVKYLYNYQEDSLLKHNLIGDYDMEALLNLEKAFIQQYNNRMITNELKYNNHD
ncbi:MAG: sulfatase-like hydrolase/transferase [Bacteroidales bacterium]|nr:sulfatase-like hydrolase/transferase [Bacteroidales bacterium]